MPVFLRRLIALTFATALLLLVTWQLLSGNLPTFDGRLAFLDGITLTTPSTKPLSRTLVVASTKAEDTTWIHTELPDWPSHIYTVDDPSAALHSRNRGNEASVYLTYILSNYYNLSDITIFIHSHRNHKHGTKRDDGRPFEGVEYDNVAAIRALNLDFVKEKGYANLRCLNNPGCPAEIQPFRPESERDPLRPQEGAMPSAWTFLFPNTTVPHIIAAPCCAQFAASKCQILSRGKEDYERYLDWLYSDASADLDDATSGRVFEYLWHVIFGREVVHCPEEEGCYAEQYGMSWRDVQDMRNGKGTS